MQRPKRRSKKRRRTRRKTKRKERETLKKRSIEIGKGEGMEVAFSFRQKKQKWTENAQARRERNRKSARESRLRKKNFVSNLEDKVIDTGDWLRSKNLKLKLNGNGLLLRTRII